MATRYRLFGKRERALHMSPVPIDIRPNFGKLQIRNQRQIHKDQKIRIRNIAGYKVIVTVTRGPYRENGHLKIDFEFLKGKELETGTIFLEDHSVIRDQTGNWSSVNWLERV